MTSTFAGYKGYFSTTKFGSFKVDKASSTPYSDATKVRIYKNNAYFNAQKYLI